MKKDRNLHPKDMSPEKIINIKKPCQENWDGMTLSPAGRFCGSCEKVVHDLTEKSDAELIQLIESKGENMCGRLIASQLNRPLIAQTQPPRISSTLSLKVVVLGIGLLACFPAFSMEEPPNQSDVDLISVIQSNSRLKTEDSLQITDSIIEIRFILLNPENQEPISYEKAVFLDENENILGGAISDYDGEFVLRVSPELNSKIDSIEIGRNSFQYKSIILNWEEFKKNPPQTLSIQPWKREEIQIVGLITEPNYFDIHNPNPSTTFKRKKAGSRD